MKKKKLSPEDHEFINSLSAAMTEHTPRKMRWALYFWAVTIAIFILWASLTQIDEITRGTGKVVPSGENKVVQNLEGGIVKEIYVKVGDEVKKGQPLLKIDNEKSKAQYGSSTIKRYELEAKIIRLKAEAEGKPFTVPKELSEKMPQLVENERSLYLSKEKEIKAKLQALRAQKKQKEDELQETKDKIVHLIRTNELIDEEVKMMRPMVEQGVKSKVDFMKLQREQSQIKSDLSSAQNAIPRIKAAISEIENNIEEAKTAFENKAKEELNEATAEKLRVQKETQALSDQVHRTIVRSPINGIIQTLFINTIGGVIQPGADLVEIVPTDETLWLEVKIKPSDIAFIYPGQKAIVKITAYDFRIYGSLEGEVVHISADTTKDEKDNVFYIIHVKTKKNYLGSEKKPLKIIPGMTVNVDIMTGKKTIMDYILKPILKAKQYTFTER